MIFLVGLIAIALGIFALAGWRRAARAEALLAGERRGHETQIAELRRATEEKIALVQGDRAAFSTEMRAIAGTAVGEAAEHLQRLSAEGRKADHQEVKQAISPIAQHLENVEREIRLLAEDRKRTEGAVSQMFRSMGDEVGRLRLETGQLVSALKRPQVRGAWGEMQLKNVVRAANMTEHVDFHVQPTLGSPEDGRLRPDMTVHLPSERDVVVDSKVPLEGYLAAIEATDDVSRDAEMDRHARQLRTHVDKLASKAYHAQLEESAEFVICFLPNEAVYCAALDRDPSLLEHGAAKGVLIATPTTLLALLYACAYGWQQASIEESAREIAAAARELHKRCGKFVDDFARTGRMLGSAMNAYNTAVGSLEARVLPQLRRMEDAGAGSERDIAGPAPLDTPARLVTAPERAGDPPAGLPPVEAA